MSFRRTKRSRSLPPRRKQDPSADDAPATPTNQSSVKSIRSSTHSSSFRHSPSPNTSFRHRPTSSIASNRRWTADEGTFGSDEEPEAVPPPWNVNRSPLFVDPPHESSGLPAWLFEIDDDDPRPLFEELNLDVMQFIKKVMWVLVWMWIPSPQIPLPTLLHADFWGALLVVFLYAVVLLKGQFRVVPWVLLIWSIGSSILWFLDHSLGHSLSLTQFMAVTGYSTIPLILSTLILILLHPPPIATIVIQFTSVAWSTISCTVSLRQRSLGDENGEASDVEWGEAHPPPRRHSSREWLLVYPIVLLNLYLASLYTRHSH